MGRSQETNNKKEIRKKKAKKRKEKELKKQARKENKKTNTLDDMIAYVDENGTISETPPDPDRKKNKAKIEDIEVGIPKQEEKPAVDDVSKGKLSYFNESKGYGFIRDTETNETIFAHIKNFVDPIEEGDLVNFKTEKGKKGLFAVNITLQK